MAVTAQQQTRLNFWDLLLARIDLELEMLRAENAQAKKG